MKQVTNAESVKVVIESIDSTTLCIKDDVLFVVADLRKLFRILAIEDLSEIKNSCQTINATKLKQLQGEFGFSFDVEESDEITLRSWHWLDELPYKCHTGRELTMMLEGKKPLSIFSVFTSECQETQDFAEAVFDVHVEKGAFVKHQEFIRDDHSPAGVITIRYVFYALKAEEWRIKAFLLLRDSTRNVQWNDSFERIEGALLGYSEIETNAYLSLKNGASGQRLW